MFMKKIAFIALFIPLISFAKVNIDSLRGVWNDTAQSDTTRLKAIKKISWDAYLYTQPDSAFYWGQKQYDFAKAKGLKKYAGNALNTQAVSLYYKGDYDAALIYATKNLTLQKEAGDEDGISSALITLGQIYSEKGDYIKTIAYYSQSLAIFKNLGNKKGIARCLNNIGLTYANQGIYSEAIDYYLRSIKIKEELGDKRGMANSLYNIASIYRGQGDLAKAEEYYSASLKKDEEIGNKKGVAYSLNAFGIICQEKGEYDKAIDYHNKSLKIKTEVGSKKGMANSLNNIGTLYYQKGEYDKALKYHYKSLEIKEKMGHKKLIAGSLANIGWVYLGREDYRKALNFGERALKIAQELGVIYEIQETAQLLWEANKKSGNFKQGLAYHELYIASRDSAKSKENQIAIIQQGLKFDYEKKEAVAKAQHAAEIEQERLASVVAQKKQDIIIYTISIGAFLLILFLAFVFNRLKITKKQKNEIDHQKKLIEQSHRETEEQKLILEEKNKEITESITYAKRIQEAILPPPRIVKEWLTESFIFYKPKDIVAGDFYWMETVKTSTPSGEKTLVFFAAADCTGHGVPGAMLSVVCANALNRAVKEFQLTNPGKVLDKVAELVTEAFEKDDEQIKDGMDIALCALDISTKKVYYSGANNPLYRITTLNQKAGGKTKIIGNETHQLIEYKGTKQAVGYNDRPLAFETLEIQLEPGDAIYLFSDGFPDQFGGVKGKKYKYSSFKKTLLGYFSEPMEIQKQLLAREFDAWQGSLEQIDDVCVIGVRINGKEKKNFTKRELEVLDLVKEGLPSKLIADKMNISKLTVDTYRKRLLAKTGTHNATELIAYCVEKEIV